MKFTVKLSDEVTYVRELVMLVEAEDEDEAKEKVLEAADELMSQATYEDGLEETQIDNTPYEAEVIPSETPLRVPPFEFEE